MKSTQIKDIPDEVRAKYALIFISVIFFLCFALALWHWWLFFSPIVLILAIQVIGTHKVWRKWIVAKYGQIRYRKQRKANDLPISTTTEKKITISDWLVTDMVEAACSQDYKSCNGLENYERLKNDFIESIGDDNTIAYKDFIKTTSKLRADINLIISNVNILKTRWSRSALKYLRGLHYNRPFTPESYLDDCRFMDAVINNLKRQIRQAEDRYNNLSLNTESSAPLTIEKYTESIENILIDIEEITKVNYNINGMYVSKLAQLMKRRNQHIKIQKERLAKMKQ